MRRAARLTAACLVAAACGTPALEAPRPTATPLVVVTASPIASAPPVAVGGFVATPVPDPVTVFGMDPDGRPTSAQCPTWVEFATPHLTYTAAELSAISDALVGVSPSGVSPSGANRMPPSLRSVAVAPTGATTTWLTQSRCSLNLQITNTTRETIRIGRVGWRLTGLAPLAADRLRLLDWCSSMGRDPCGPPGGGGGVGTCDFSLVEITVAPGPPGVDYAAEPVGYLDDGVTKCPPIALRPGRSMEVGIRLTATDPGVYRMMPVVEVSAGGATTTIPVWRLAAGMAFADAGHFRCFALQGRSFVEAASGEAAVSGEGGLWCV